MSLIRKHGAVLQAWACLDLVLKYELIQATRDVKYDRQQLYGERSKFGFIDLDLRIDEYHTAWYGPLSTRRLSVTIIDCDDVSHVMWKSFLRQRLSLLSAAADLQRTVYLM